MFLNYKILLNLKITFVRKQNLSLFSFLSFISFLYNIMTKHNYELLHNLNLRNIKAYFTQRYALYSKRRLYTIKIINSMFKVRISKTDLKDLNRKDEAPLYMYMIINTENPFSKCAYCQQTSNQQRYKINI